jgi:divalent metal cation (Fe/Co/Zn/Cd) transporter
MVSWVSTAFEQVWLLVGKGAPKEFLSKVIYLAITHDSQILKIDTVCFIHLDMPLRFTTNFCIKCRAYHAGEKYYVEVDIIMDESAPLKVTHDVSQTLQRKIEGLEDVERAFVHVRPNSPSSSDVRERRLSMH